MGRANGTKKANGDPLPAVADVTSLPMAPGVPDPPPELQLEGRALWERAWGEAITWLSPDSDWDWIAETCALADDVAAARRRYRATTDPKDAKALADLSKQLTSGLSALGFSPTARSRLGVAEVRRVSALEDLLAKRRGKG